MRALEMRALLLPLSADLDGRFVTDFGNSCRTIQAAIGAEGLHPQHKFPSSGYRSSLASTFSQANTLVERMLPGSRLERRASGAESSTPNENRAS